MSEAAVSTVTLPLLLRAPVDENVVAAPQRDAQRMRGGVLHPNLAQHVQRNHELAQRGGIFLHPVFLRFGKCALPRTVFSHREWQLIHSRICFKQKRREAFTEP